MGGGQPGSGGQRRSAQQLDAGCCQKQRGSQACPGPLPRQQVHQRRDQSRYMRALTLMTIMVGRPGCVALPLTKSTQFSTGFFMPAGRAAQRSTAGSRRSRREAASAAQRRAGPAATAAVRSWPGARRQQVCDPRSSPGVVLPTGGTSRLHPAAAPTHRGACKSRGRGASGARCGTCSKTWCSCPRRCAPAALRGVVAQAASRVAGHEHASCTQVPHTRAPSQPLTANTEAEE